MLPGTNKKEAGDPANEPQSALAVEIPPHQGQSPEENEGPSKKESTPVSPKSPVISQGKPPPQASVLPSDFVPSHGQDEMPSWSASSDKQLGSPGSLNDRVFPIRSVVSVDSSQTPYLFTGRTSGEQNDYFPSGVVPAGVAGQDVASPARPHPSASESDGRPTPRTRRPETQASNDRSREDRKASDSKTYNALDKYGSRGIQLFNDAGSETKSTGTGSASFQGTLKSSSIGSNMPDDQEGISGLVTARFKHIVTAEGHAVITGRDGETLQRCEDEPIHIPGAVRMIIRPFYNKPDPYLSFNVDS